MKKSMNDFPLRLSWTDFVYDLAEMLRDHSIETPLYLVGGAVRDACLRGAIHDIDIAVDGDAIALARKVADWLGADIYIMDRERGVARLFVKHLDEDICIDFARLRGATLEEDLLDRDFTINAMAADLLGDLDVLIDPLAGETDLQRKVLSRCSPRSISDDPIRAIRAVRLSAQFDLKIHPDTAADIRRQADGLTESSGERIRDEFFKLLGLDNSARGLRVLQHLGVLAYIVPPVSNLVSAVQPPTDRFDAWTHTLAVVERMSAILKAISSRRTDNTAAAFDLGMLAIQFDRYRSSLQKHINQVYGNGRRHSELLTLAALLHNTGSAEPPDPDQPILVVAEQVIAVAEQAIAVAEQAIVVAERLKLTVVEQKALSLSIRHYRQIVERPSWTDIDRHRFWFQLGDHGIDAILLCLANVLGSFGTELKQEDWLQLVETVTILLDTYFNRYEEVVKPKLLLNGEDLQNLLNIRPGPLVGQLLTALREAQVSGDVRSSQDARDFILRQAKTLES